MNRELVARLARACAHGPQQMQLVTELLTGPVNINYENFGPKVYVRYGHARVQSTSFHNLKKRLVANGFVFQRPGGDTVRMTFPEAQCH